jgi:hypothetical protein
MEGISKINYKDKMIYYVDYTSVEDTDEKTIQLLQNVTLEYQILQLPSKSVLALVNITNRQFNIKVVNAFKAEREVTTPYEKKIAIIGMDSLQEVAYNFLIGLTLGDLIKTFNSEFEAKEWLVQD